jgi:PIN domain nuclease of toxin-antitoxin system
MRTFLKVVTQDYNFRILQITENHLFRYLGLPLIHRDPFDRLIYSQAKSDRVGTHTEGVSHAIV